MMHFAAIITARIFGTALLLGLVKVAPILAPQVAHIINGGVVDERVGFGGLFGHCLLVL